MKNNGTKNIIFDLGGVILNIDMKKTEQAFVNLGIENFGELYNQFHASALFADLETGKITPGQFIETLQKHTNGVSREEIVVAWNAMLLNFPLPRIRLLQRLKESYRTFLLSNTNAIHYDAFQNIYRQSAGDNSSLNGCFHKAYYSHDLGLRKPGKEIYQQVLREQNLVAEETLFIDDTPANVEAASSVNIMALYLKSPETIEDVLADY